MSLLLLKYNFQGGILLQIIKEHNVNASSSYKRVKCNIKMITSCSFNWHVTLTSSLIHERKTTKGSLESFHKRNVPTQPSGSCSMQTLFCHSPFAFSNLYFMFWISDEWVNTLCFPHRNPYCRSPQTFRICMLIPVQKSTGYLILNLLQLWAFFRVNYILVTAKKIKNKKGAKGTIIVVTNYCYFITRVLQLR